jgi:polyketide synthase PksN
MELKSILKALKEKKITPEEARKEMKKFNSETELTDFFNESKNESNIESDISEHNVDNLREKNWNEDDRIAIVGISGRYPTADNMVSYWDVLVNGKNTIREIPTTRWDTEKYYDPKNTKEGSIYSKWLGMLDDVECFDSLFFEIPPSEAEVMDPQHRLFLEEGYKAFEDAGYSQTALNNKKCGVYLGIVNGEYDALNNKNGMRNISVTSNSNAIGVARIAYYLNLKGPAISIDTACSSSLVSTHLAIQALRNGEIDMALAGGVSLYLSPESYINMCAAGMLSPDGQCKAFDNSANGFVPGEGVGAIILKRLKDAKADGDYIYGTIIGSAINQDGKTNGITAPNLNSQVELVDDLYNKFNIDPVSISYAEMHGTGTKLGDPIELEALATAYGKKTDVKNYCAIGSVKSNLGHTSAAAAMAGIHKILLSMKHKKLVPTLHVNTPNEHFDLKDSPFYINCETKEWDSVNGFPRRAAISSFGYSGTNAHAVIEEYNIDEENRITKVIDEENPGIFVLSAKNQAQLTKYIQNIKHYVEHHHDINFADLLYTLQVGREPMDERLAIITFSMEDLSKKLSALLEGRLSDPDCFRGRITRNKAKNKRQKTSFSHKAASDKLTKQELYRHVNSWVNGEKVEWDYYYLGYEPRRIPLPTYPFERDIHWFNKEEDHLQNATMNTNINTLHPLLHQNTSNFSEHSFQSVFTGDEFFVREHILNDSKMLPGAAILEMARKAGEFLGEKYVSAISNISWNHPIKMDEEGQVVKIRLLPEGDRSTFEVSIPNPNKSKENSDDEILCAEGVIEYERLFLDSESLDINAYKSRCLSSINTKKNYEDIKESGLIYGQHFQTVEEAFYNNKEVLAKLKLNVSNSQVETKDYVLHPGLLDGAMQTISVFLQEDGTDEGLVYLPFSMGKVKIYSSLTDLGYVYTTIANKKDKNIGRLETTKNVMKSFDIIITDKKGSILVEISNFNLRPVQTKVNNKLPKEMNSLKSAPTFYYKKVWEVENSSISQARSSLTGTILLFDVNHELYNVLQTQTEAAIFLVKPGKQYDQLDNNMVVIDPTNKHDYKILFESLSNKGIIPNKIIYNWSSDPIITGHNLINNRMERGVYSVLLLSQAITESKVNSKIQLVYVYHSTNNYEVPENSAMKGFFITLQKENPLFSYKTVELLDTSISLYKIAILLIKEFLINGQGFEIRYDGVNRWVSKIRETNKINKVNNSEIIKNNGVYIITGGMGGLGLIFARYISEQGNTKIVLTGRRDLHEQDLEIIREIESFGSEVLYVKADISKQDDVEELVTRVKDRFNKINGIIHSAGVKRDSLYWGKEIEEMKEVVAAKVFGTRYLDEALMDEPLDFFVMFSSLASVVGNIGQCDYSYGNSYLDHFAIIREELRAKGQRFGKTLSINWPFWKDGGMDIDYESKKWMEEQGGIYSLYDKEGIKAFEDGLLLNVPQLIVVKGIQEKIVQLIHTITGELNRKVNSGQEQDTASVRIAENVNTEKANERLREETNQFLKEVLAEKTKISVDKIDMLEPFEKYGIDSILIMSLTRLLEKSFGELSKTLFFEYRNLNELSEYFISEKLDQLVKLFGTSLIDRKDEDVEGIEVPILTDIEKPKMINSLQNNNYKQEDIAIIGVSGRYPHADNLEQFWDILRNGKDCITEIPKERWDYRKFYDKNKQNLGKSYSKWGGFIKDVAMFDSLFFNIPPIEAEVMDPQTRLFMEVAWHTLEDAGYTRASLDKDKVGVFVGVMNGMYELFETEVKEKGIPIGSSFASIANQVSYFCNFNGPSMAIDTMCSSSLTAIHLGAESIRNGESDLVIAGGVNLILHPNKYLLLSMGKFASSDGRCKSFGEGGDGYVPGEGIGAVLLKPLKKAIADKDHIYAVIKGSAINSGGKTSGFTVPNPNAQGDLVDNVFQKTGIDPETISYIETHGTGTSLGDPIEITGLTKAFRKQTQRNSNEKHCSIGSVKSNIGHLESAAGMAALTKVLLQMQKQKLVPSIHSNPLNPNINFKHTPFYVQQQLQQWDEPVINKDGKTYKVPRRAGISSFGAGGSNAHMIVEEYKPVMVETLVENKEPKLFVVSAKNKERVREYVLMLTEYISKKGVGQFSNYENLANGLQDEKLSFEKIHQVIIGIFADLLGINKGNIDSKVSIEEYGLDIVQSTKFMDAVNQKLDLNMSEWEFTAYSSIYSLTTYISRLMSKEMDSDVKAGTECIDASSIAYTLQVGREAMEERVAIIAESSEVLLHKLQLYLDGSKNIEKVYEGNVLDNKQKLKTIIEEKTGGKSITHLIDGKKLEIIAELWVAGGEIDWNQLYKEEKPFRISLPTYPFSKERFWPKIMKESVSNQHLEMEVIHPLLTKNTSTINGLRYSTIFNGREFFLEDHIINGKKILPGVTYLEMARAAIADLLEISDKNDGAIKINNVVWIQPFEVDNDNKTLHISIIPNEYDELKFTLYSDSEDGSKESLVHCEGIARINNTLEQSRLDIELLKSQCNVSRKSGESFYTIFENMGINYGPSHMGIEAVYKGENQMIASLILPEIEAIQSSEFILHPSLLDSALQATIGFSITDEINSQMVLPNNATDKMVNLPFAVDEIEIIRSCSSKMWAYIYIDKQKNEEKVQKINIELCDSEGNVCIRIKRLAFRTLQSENKSTSITQERETQKLLITKKWNAMSINHSKKIDINNQRIVFLCEPDNQLIVEIESRLPNTKCIPLRSNANTIPEKYTDYAAQMLHESRKIHSNKSKDKILIQLFIHTNTDNQTLTGLLGLLKTAQLENHNMVCQLVESQQEISMDDICVYLEKSGEISHEQHIRYIGNRSFVCELEQSIVESDSYNNPCWKNGGVYLITGGTGGLGFIIAKEIAQRTNNVTLILLGRSQLNEKIDRQIKNLESFGAQVLYRRVDVTNMQQVTDLMKVVVNEFENINGIIHCSGIVRDNFIVKKKEEELRAVLAPKVSGIYNLDEATKEIPLDIFIIFSSLAGVMGNIGQADYAAGNAFMDSYAEYRNQLTEKKVRFGHAISINWPLWREGGMTISKAMESMIQVSTGLVPMKTAAGISLLYESIRSGQSQVLALEGDSEKIIRYLYKHTSDNNFIDKSLEQEKAEIVQENRKEKLSNILKRMLSSELNLDVGRIDSRVPLDTYGINSIMIMQLTNQLEKSFGSLPKTLFFEYQSLIELCNYFCENYPERVNEMTGLKKSLAIPAQVKHKSMAGEKMFAQRNQKNKPQIWNSKNDKSTLSESKQTSDNDEMDIAIIGVSGKYPHADNLIEFWSNLKEGKDCITEIPKDRWDHSIYYDKDKRKLDKTYTKWGGFLNGIDQFDPLFFNIAPSDAQMVDPQERLFLQCAYNAIEDAGYTRHTLGKNKVDDMESNVGVYVGVMYEEYQLYGAQAQAKGHMLSLSGSPASIANRVSYICGFNGPSMAVDTMCSSSLVSIHLACQSIRNGECETAIAGGVNLSLHPNKFLMLGQNKFMSSKGRCESFGKDGDGYTPGEGVGAIVLKPKAKAIADGDNIYGIIKGSAVNHGGKTNGYTVPNPRAQASLINKVLKRSGVNPRTISYIEAHGTGTALGDPIEIAGLNKAFDEYTKDKQFCLLGSVKSNIGHCESAAGIAGLTKVLMQMKHKQIVPSLHSSELNSNIDFENSPFIVPQTLSEWKRPIIVENGVEKEYPRMAGISAFGAGGANAHLIVEEYIPEEQSVEEMDKQNQNPIIITLSARKKEQLNEVAKQMYSWIQNESPSYEKLKNIAYTLQVGRESMEERLAFIVNSSTDFEEKLNDFLKGSGDYYRGQAKSINNVLHVLDSDVEFQNVLDTWFKQLKYSKILELWVKGLTIEWSNFYSISEERKRLSLPTYPFAKERYWVPEVEDTQPNNISVRNANAIHPLVHSNTSDFNQQKYSTVFTGRESIFSDHMINGTKTLPAVAYIEMAYVAIRNAFNMDEDKAITFEFRDITWIRPLTVDDKSIQVHLALDLEETNEVSFKIYSVSEETPSIKTIYCEGVACFGKNSRTPEIDLRERLNECNKKEIKSEAIYEQFKSIGIHYGAEQRGIASINLGQNQVLAHLVLPKLLTDSMEKYQLHPCILDSALQAAIGISLGHPKPLLNIKEETIAPKLPFMIKRMTIYKGCSSSMWSSIRPSNKRDNENNRELLDIDLCDTNGEVCVRIEEIYFRSIQQSGNKKGLKKLASNENIKPLTFSTEWIESALDKKDQSREYNKRILVLCEVDDHIESELYRKCEDCQIITLKSDSSNIAQRFNNYSIAIFEEIKNLIGSHSQDSTLIQVLVPQSFDNYPFMGIASLLKTANIENPNIFGQVIRVTNSLESSDIVTTLKDNAKYSQDYSVLYKDGKRFVLTIKEEEGISEEQRSPVWKNEGVYLITGGMGGLGLIFAKEIVNKVKNAVIVLTGRSPLTVEKQSILNELETKDATLVYYQADVSVEDSVMKLIEKIQVDYGKLNGIMHCAGLVKDNFIYKKTLQEFLEVLSPKTQGIINLDFASKAIDLDFFVLCSSLSGVTGNIGQADYAAANAFMDAFAAYRDEMVRTNRRSGQTISINWPLWQDGGMNIEESFEKAIRDRTGMTTLRTETGLELFYRSMALNKNQIIAVEGDAEKVRSILVDLENEKKNIKLLPQLQEVVHTSNENIHEKASLFIKQIFAEALKIPIQEIEEYEPLERYGIDSILIMKLTDLLENTFGPLPKTLLFEYQNINSVTKYFVDKHYDQLIKHIGISDNETPIEKYEKTVHYVEMDKTDQLDNHFDVEKKSRFSAVVNQEKETVSDIAIIGMSGAFAQAENLDEFWENLQQGRDCITEVPLSRWDHSNYFNEDKNHSGTAYTKWGGFMKNVDSFDPLFFNITPTDAVIMDPQERLFMKSVYEAIEDAGYTRHELGYNPGSDVRRNVGVYVGVMNEDYQLYAAQEQKVGNPIVLSGNPSSIANRVSYFFDFHGPSLAIDTMCSSSLVAIHMACQAIKQGECEYAIAGGVNVLSHPNKYLLISQSKFASTNGRCVSFGKGGDGYVPGEGVGSLLLKPKDKAIADGDQIYGIIKGSSVNHGGKTNGYTVPNPVAQAEVISRALNVANISPDTLSYIEAHGTGTALGDPIEITALKKAFGDDFPNTQKCAIGSVKSNVGHCESASGIASISKVLLQMKHKKIVPSLHSQELNPNIDFNTSPFFVPQELIEWERPKVKMNGTIKEYPRRSGISSFGAGGANAHIIIEEYISNETEMKNDYPQINQVVIVLSAKTKEQLKMQANNLIEAVRNQKVNENNLVDVAYTLQVGREEMEERIAFVITSLEMLIEKLTEFVIVQDATKDIFLGQVYGKSKSLLGFETAGDLSKDVQNCIKLCHFEKICEYWVNGVKIDWNSLYDKRQKRVSLPTYPFEHERYWVTVSPDMLDQIELTSKIHPLIHVNNSSLYKQHFYSNFSGNEFFLRDHCLGERKVLPGAATLEMARIVGELSTETKVNVLKNVIWLNQIEVSDKSNSVKVKVYSNNDKTSFEISTTVENEPAEDMTNNEMICTEGQLEFRDDLYATLDSKTIDIEKIKSRCHRIELGKDCYESMADKGLINGASFQVIQEIHSNDFEAIANLSLNSDLDESLHEYTLHPALLNGIFQSVLGLMGNQDESNPVIFLPFALSEMRMLGPITKDCVAYVTPSSYSKKSQSSTIQKFDITITDESGNILVTIDEFTLKAFYVNNTVQETVDEVKELSLSSLNSDSIFENQYYTTEWYKTPYNKNYQVLTKHIQGTIIIFDQDEELYKEIKALLRKGNDTEVILVKPGDSCKVIEKHIYEVNPMVQEDYQQLFEMLNKQKLQPNNIIFNRNNGKSARTDEELDEHLEHGIYSLFYLSQALMKQKINYKVKLLFTFVNEEGEVIPEYSAISGFAKTIRMEKPTFIFKTVELQKTRSFRKESRKESIAQILINEFEIEDSEVEIRYEGSNRLVKEVKSIGFL